MRFILLVLVILFGISTVSADYTIGGSSGALWDGNSSSSLHDLWDNETVVVGTSVYLNYDNIVNNGGFELGNLTHPYNWTDDNSNDDILWDESGVHANGVYAGNRSVRSYLYGGGTNRYDSDTYSCTENTEYMFEWVIISDTGAGAYPWKIWTDIGEVAWLDGKPNTWTPDNYIFTTQAGASTFYVQLYHHDNANISIDNIKIYLNQSAPRYSSGNRTAWNDSSTGNVIYKYDVNTTGNYTFYQGNNGTGVFVQEGSTHYLNQTITVTSGTKYQNADARVNITDGELISITFYEQASAGSVDITYYNLDYDNLTANVNINISNKTGALSYINLTHVGNLSSEYCLCYPNGTAVQACITATSEGQIIWFNGSADRLPEAINYSINETFGTSTILIPANTYGMINNWTVATNFTNIAANESNDVCYTYYNVTTGEWESHYVGYSWNSDYVIPLEASVMMCVNTQTTITAAIVTPSSTELYTGWNMVFVEGTDNETIADIKSDIGTNCTDVWAFNSSAGAYTNSSTYSVQYNQGFLAYINTAFTWSRSDL